MHIAMLLPSPGALSRVEYLLWRDTINCLTRDLSLRGSVVTTFPESASAAQARSAEGKCFPEEVFSGKAGDFDLVHGYFDPLIAVYAGIRGVPAVMTLGTVPDRPPVPALQCARDRLRSISLSDGVRKKGVPYHATIYPGLDMERYRFQARSKGYVLFLPATRRAEEIRAARVMTERSGRRLVVAGWGDGRRPALASAVGLDNSPEFVEVSSVKDVIRLLGGAYALLRLGRVKPFSLAVIASMACGTPVVSCRGGDLSEFITPEVTGFTVSSPDEAVEALFRVGGLDRRYCRHVSAERFRMDRMAEEYHAVYTGLHKLTKQEDHRPWGYYRVLYDEEQCKVKRITVYPGKRLSLQRHAFRAEHWHIVAGRGLVTCGDEERLLGSGESIDIPPKALHRVENPGPEHLVFVEVQRGDYCGEDDIERFEDDYGRV